MLYQLLAILCLSRLSSTLPDVEDLEGAADFKSITLHWKYPRSLPRLLAFQITYCEDQAWGPNRCKKKVIDRPLDNEIPTSDTQQRMFLAEIYGLRMSTNYTVDVTPNVGGFEPSTQRGRSMNSQIVIKTKGFSAKATRCLANSSIVEINTGPNFGGKIYVENSEDAECTAEGDRKSERTSYLLKINHFTCGSEVLNSSVRTFIMVQENLSILTHSTRRFMVICTYVPETFTVRAGVFLPEYDDNQTEFESVDHSVNEVDPSELFDSSNSLFDATISGEVGRALKLSAKDKDKKPEMWAHLILMVILVMAAVIGLSCAIWHFVKQSRTQNRTGFMSPQMEPSAVEEDSSLEAVVRDFVTDDGELLPPLVENPVALSFLTETLDTDSSTDFLYHLQEQNLPDPGLAYYEESDMDDLTDNPHDQFDDLIGDDPSNNPDLHLSESFNRPINFITEDLRLSSSSFDQLGHLSSLGPGTSVDCDLLSMTNQLPLLSYSDSPLPYSSMSLNILCDPSLDNTQIDCTDLPTLSEMPSALLHYDSNPPLLLDPRTLPHLMSMSNLYNLEIDRLDSVTPTPINLALAGIPLDITMPIASISLDTLNDSFSEDEDEIEDEVFLTCDSDNDSVIENPHCLISDEETVESQSNPVESNWKLGDGEGALFPAVSM